MALAVDLESMRLAPLQELMEKLSFGETVTLLSPDGKPVAMLISLKPERAPSGNMTDWQAQWETLARDVSRAWKSEKSALEILTETRR